MQKKFMIRKVLSPSKMLTNVDVNNLVLMTSGSGVKTSGATFSKFVV